MLQIFKSVDDTLTTLEAPEKGCWVHMTAPTQEEVASVAASLQLEADFLNAALDEEESPRIEMEDGQTLVLVDIPMVEVEGKTYVYATIPFGIILSEDSIVTVCLQESSIIRDFTDGRVRGFWTFKRSRFVLQLLYRNASRFLAYLRQLDRASTPVEQELHKSMRNKELIQMLTIEKSLVYFSTSLKSNEVVLEKLLRQEFIRKYPEDADLLQDVIIENKQAIDMCSIYKDVLSGTMDAFASVISNNLNIVMKVLTSITLVISIPTLIASFMGMNVPMPLAGNPYGFWIVAGISAVVSLVSIAILYRKKMF